MVEIKRSQANVESIVKRLTKEKELYEKDQISLKQKLAIIQQLQDKYEIRLLTEQITETEKALEMVNKQLEEYLYDLGEK